MKLELITAARVVTREDIFPRLCSKVTCHSRRTGAEASEEYLRDAQVDLGAPLEANLG